MRKFNLFVIAALMGSMTFTACTPEDNAVAPSAPSGELSDDIDMFKTVKANEGDPAVVAALKSIPNVAEVKPFINVGRANNEEIALGQCYYIKRSWEFRTIYNKTYYRLFAFWDKDINTLVVATHGIVKKTQKTPKSEITKAEGIRKLYFENKNKKI